MLQNRHTENSVSEVKWAGIFWFCIIIAAIAILALVAGMSWKANPQFSALTFTSDGFLLAYLIWGFPKISMQ